jgi:hypothetical protein
MSEDRLNHTSASSDSPHGANALRTRSDQLHLRLRTVDLAALRRLASDRDQTLSATVRFLLRHYLGSRDSNQ